MEEWKVISDYPNYSVSSFGNVRNDKKNKILKPFINHWGYYKVGLFNNGIRKGFRVNRLVAVAFIENPENKPIVDHIDRNKINNNINNLRWSTNIESCRNTTKRCNTSSSYKGVSYRKNTGKWRCRIRIDYKLINLGEYENEVDAALSYNKYIIDNNLQEYFNLNNIQ
jgi:hypothetical protein